MNRALIDRVANAVLYEGYILYPYRPSVKNRQRWTFGGLYPESFCRDARGTESASAQTQCLVRGSPKMRLEVAVRFLHLIQRQVLAGPNLLLVDSLRVGDRIVSTWQEAEEREVGLGDLELHALLANPVERGFSFEARQWQAPLVETDGTEVGLVARTQDGLDGVLEVSAEAVASDLVRVTVRIANRTPLDESMTSDRDAALLRTLVSAHVVLGVRDGRFVSLLDPPDDCRGLAAACCNRGLWPVLVGDEGSAEAMLASPIILYDYPQVAPESPGDLFDSTEIDEILTLRILTLTDEEKRQVAGVDERARALLTRTEALADEELASLHGALRQLRAPRRGGE